jgi:hypothetical protein
MSSVPSPTLKALTLLFAPVIALPLANACWRVRPEVAKTVQVAAAAVRTQGALAPDAARVAAYTRVKSRAAAAATGALRVAN